jgi:hypothetical protein
MSNPECDVAILKAAAEDPAVDKAVRNTMAAQARMADATAEALYARMLDESIPAPGQMPEEHWETLLRQVDEQQRPIGDEFVDVGVPGGSGAGAPPPPPRPGGTAPPPPGGPGRAVASAVGTTVVEGAKVAWAGLMQMRVALMLSNFLTQVKNIATTGAMAGVVRPLEEATAIAISKMSHNPENVRSFQEMHHYGTGMLRAASEIPSVFKSLGEGVLRSGTINASKAREALQKAGYAPELARSKIDITLNQSPTEVTLNSFSELFTAKGFGYLFNAAFGSQFAALQGVDTGFKMISHRAKIQQMLAKEGMSKGIYGESLDVFVSQNWDRMADQIKKTGGVTDEFSELSARGVKQAAEDTFTETAQTPIGSFFMGKFGGPPSFAKTAFSETMQLLAPFRSIYVNLMRQSLSRRLLPFIDKQTRMEWSGALGAERQQLAQARTAAAWTLAVGTGVLLDQMGAEIFGGDEINAQARALQYDLYGKVGNTIKIGDQYIPLDVLPPSIGYPLGYFAALKKGINEFNYRYHDPDDREAFALKALAPLMRSVTDGPWVKEYMDFLSKSSFYVQSGDMEGLQKYYAELTVAPMKMPNWMSEAFGVDITSARRADGPAELLMSQLLNDPESYSLRRNIFGQVIPKLARMGPQSDKPWYGGDEDTAKLLTAARYDMVLARANPSTTVDGDGNGMNGVKAHDDSIPMDRKALEKFEYYAGQSRAGSGMTFQEELRELMNAPGIWDFQSDKPRISEVQLQTLISKMHEQRRKTARELVKYHPEFGIREKQIEKFYRRQVEQGIDPAQADQIRQAKYRDLEQKRLALSSYF